MRGYIPPQDEEEKLLQRRVADAVKAVSATGCCRFTGFLNEREMQLATAQLNKMGPPAFCFFGGFEGAERAMLCVFEDTGEGEEPEFPITAAKITLKAEAPSLTHRDYLGAVLGTGIKRSMVGDIQTTPDGAVLWLQSSIMPFLQDELTGIGRVGAVLEILENPQEAAPQTPHTAQSATASVASLRLDAVLAAMLHTSRSEAAALVTGGRVQVNHLPVESVHYTVAGQDVFSVRGHGKYKLENVGGKSRKNRLFIEYMKY